jgi:hypothetical protein
MGNPFTEAAGEAGITSKGVIDRGPHPHEATVGVPAMNLTEGVVS